MTEPIPDQFVDDAWNLTAWTRGVVINARRSRVPIPSLDDTGDQSLVLRVGFLLGLTSRKGYSIVGIVKSPNILAETITKRETFAIMTPVPFARAVARILRMRGINALIETRRDWLMTSRVAVLSLPIYEWKHPLVYVVAEWAPVVHDASSQRMNRGYRRRLARLRDASENMDALSAIEAIGGVPAVSAFVNAFRSMRRTRRGRKG